MAMNVLAAVAPRQSAPDDLTSPGRSANADLEQWLGDLRQALADTGWKPEALDTYWETSRGYANRLVNGEKPWSVERQLQLPMDVRERLDHLRAARHGLIVVKPVEGPDAIVHFVGGFVGVLSAAIAAPRPQLVITGKAIG